MPKDPDFWADREEAPTQTPPRGRSRADLNVTAGSDGAWLRVRCGEDPVLVLTPLDAAGKELLCFHRRLGCTMHLRTADLSPSEDVEVVLTALRKTR